MPISLSDREYIQAGQGFLELVAATFAQANPPEFAAKSSGKPKQCSKGFSCKNTCISKLRECSNSLQGQAKTYAGWLQMQVAAGNKLSGSHKADADAMGLTKPAAKKANPPSTPNSATPAPTKPTNSKTTNSATGSTPPKTVEALAQGAFVDTGPAKKAVKLPDGVNIDADDTGPTYKFNAGGAEVNVYFYQGKQEISVSFEVNGSMTMAKLPQDQKNLIALKVLKIMRYDVSQRPDGTKYSTVADGVDKKQAYRSLAYNRLSGFSIPTNGSAGGFQYGIVKDGRLVPDAKAWEAQQEQFYSKMSEKNIQKVFQRWEKTMQKAQA